MNRNTIFVSRMTASRQRDFSLVARANDLPSADSQSDYSYIYIYVNIPFGDREFLSNGPAPFVFVIGRPPKTGCRMEYPDDRCCAPSLGIRATDIPVFPCDPTSVPPPTLASPSPGLLGVCCHWRERVSPLRDISVRDDLCRADGCRLQISDTDFTATRLRERATCGNYRSE